jgi:hypothetical protein
LSAVEQFVASAKPDAAGRIESLSARRADAMVALAQAGAAASGNANASPYLVTVHVDAETLSGEEGAGRCELDGLGDSVTNAMGVVRETARRLACDADVEVVVEDGDGNPLYMGRRSRLVRGRLRRAVTARDRCCRFPGCNRRARVETHHADDWVLGGHSDIDKVLLLCRFHHHWVHEGGGRVLAEGIDGFVFLSPEGQRLPASPAPLAGSRAAVDAHNLTARDGRCRWGGETLDLDLALTSLFSHRDFGAPLSKPKSFAVFRGGDSDRS